MSLAVAPLAAFAANTWHNQNTSPELDVGHIHGVFALDGCHIWGTAEEGGPTEQGIIIASKDGGATWAQQTLPATAATHTTMERILFTDANKGYAVGENNAKTSVDDDQPGYDAKGVPNFLTSADGGTTWVDKKGNLPAIIGTGVGHASDIEGLTAVGDKVWIAVSRYPKGKNPDRGFILYSPDRGATWTIQLTTKDGMASVSMVDANNGWGVDDDGGVWRTIDGVKWERVNFTTNTPEQIVGLDPTHFVVVGEGFIQWSDNGSTLQSGQIPTVWSNQTINDVSFSDTLHGWAVGENKHHLFSVDGGHTWKGETTNTDVNMNGVSAAAGTSFVWAVGEGSVIASNTTPAVSCPPPPAASTGGTVVVPKKPNTGHPGTQGTGFASTWALMLLLPLAGVVELARRRG